MRLYFFFALILSLSACCKDCADTTITPQEKAYIPYGENEQFYFSNGQGDTLTFTTDEKYEWENNRICKPRGRKNHCNSHLELTSSTESSEYSINFFIDKTPNELKGDIWMGSFKTPLISISAPDFDTLTINGVLYKDVFVSFKDNQPEYENQVTRLWHNKEFGVLQFTTYQPENTWQIVP